MTTYGHNEAMKEVRIAELKARLSSYLRSVRRGETVTVMDRDTPVAHIVPVRSGPSLRVRKPVAGALPLNRVPLPVPARLKVDIADILFEERQRHR